MTNYEKIQSMTLDELAEMLNDYSADPFNCYHCVRMDLTGVCNCSDGDMCLDGIKRFLASEVVSNK